MPAALHSFRVLPVFIPTFWLRGGHPPQRPVFFRFCAEPMRTNIEGVEQHLFQSLSIFFPSDVFRICLALTSQTTLFPAPHSLGLSCIWMAACRRVIEPAQFVHRMEGSTAAPGHRLAESANTRLGSSRLHQLFWFLKAAQSKSAKPFRVPI